MFPKDREYNFQRGNWMFRIRVIWRDYWEWAFVVILAVIWLALLIRYLTEGNT